MYYYNSSYFKEFLSDSNITNPHKFSYVIRNDNICKNQSVFLMIMVCIAPMNFEHRNVIRNTWGSIVDTDKEVKLLYVLGFSKNETIQNLILRESGEHGDIIQEDFIDSYENLTYKSISLLRWTSTFCNHTQYVLKIDDDIFINIPNLIKMLKHRNITNAIIGSQFVNVRPIHDKNSKWYAPREQYKGKYFPPYTSGTNYVISGDIVTKLYNASFHLSFIRLEDVYITGMCRAKIDANIVVDYGITYVKRENTGCAYEEVISGHRHTPAEMIKIWKELHDPSLNCTK